MINNGVAKYIYDILLYYYIWCDYFIGKGFIASK